MGLARIARGGAGLAAVLVAGSMTCAGGTCGAGPHGTGAIGVGLANAAPGSPSATGGASDAHGIVLAADRDDDDLDGRADGDQDVLPLAARVDLVPLDGALRGAVIRAASGGDRLRVVANGKPVAWNEPLPFGAMLQGLAPGHASLVAARGASEVAIAVDVRSYGFRDGASKDVDLAREHASIERTPPSRVEGGNDARYDDPDALRITLEEAEEDAVTSEAIVQSIAAAGTELDTLHIPLAVIPCRAALLPAHVRCAASSPVRFVIDEVDQKHPLVHDRSIRAEVGGAIVLKYGTRKMQAIRVLGPRASAIGPIGRLRATLRPFVMRLVAGGGPAVGGSEAGAVALLRGEVALASATWGQCGLTFGVASSVDVKIADPPPAHLLALGDDMGLPASGGEIRLRIDSKEVTIPIARGASPDRAAEQVARAAEQAGFVTVVSANARIAPGANGSVDVSIRRRDGRLAALDTVSPSTPLTTDASLVVRIGSVDLSDGLQHFGDMDSVAGTLEERTLIKAIDDGDPRTIEVVVVPLFAGGGRIGESFIASDRSSVRNAVILDRAGVRARRSSFTLAHELGHVLMDMPGHPDDYGVDTPTLLMDSDGSDSSPFGPRRLTIDECVRVVRQAGPNARVPLLTAWPLSVIR